MSKNYGKIKADRRRMSEILARADDYNRRREEDANKPKSKDTVDRMSIHRDIKKMLSEGKDKIEIIASLNNKYPDTHLSVFFSQWIEYHIEKEDYKDNDIEIDR